MFASKKDYWDYIYQCLYKVKGLDDGIRFVRAKSEVSLSSYSLIPLWRCKSPPPLKKSP